MNDLRHVTTHSRERTCPLMNLSRALGSPRHRPVRLPSPRAGDPAREVFRSRMYSISRARRERYALPGVACNQELSIWSSERH